MTGRLSDITARISSLRQLGTVVNAMRGLAVARAQRARAQLPAVESYSGPLLDAIGLVAGLLPPSSAAAATLPRRALVAFCAEQGFAGAFSQRILDRLSLELEGGGESDIFLVGTRGLRIAQERRLPIAWSTEMAAQTDAIPALADRIANAFYARIARCRYDSLLVVHAAGAAGPGANIEALRLFPLDPALLPLWPARSAPLMYVPPAQLLAQLTADFVHAQLCRAGLHAYAAESEARLATMAAAHGQIERRLEEMQRLENEVRQAEITAEVIEVSAGVMRDRVRPGRRALS